MCFLGELTSGYCNGFLEEKIKLNLLFYTVNLEEEEEEEERWTNLKL